jgi:hypothetical protein
MLEIADATTGNHRDVDGIGNRTRQRQIETVPVPSRSMLVSRISPAPSCWTRRAQATASMPVLRRPPWVNTCQTPGADCLASMATTMHWLPTLAEASADQIRILDGRGIHAHLVGAGIQQAPHIGHRAHAAANGQRNEHLRGTGLDDVQDDVALVRGGRDVEKGDFVGALLVVAAGDFDGSPASRRSTKLVPLTTRPAVTSRQGMMRLARPKVSYRPEFAGMRAHHGPRHCRLPPVPQQNRASHRRWRGRRWRR